jgi:thymidine kinase
LLQPFPSAGFVVIEGKPLGNVLPSRIHKKTPSTLSLPQLEGQNMSGYLHVIAGPMFSGKTQRLMGLLNAESKLGGSVVLLRHSNDLKRTLDEDKVFSHLCEITWSPPLLNISSLSDVVDTVADYKVVGVDECQFFDDLLSFTERVVGRGQHLILSGLFSDFMMRKFGSLSDVLFMTDEVEILHSLCVTCHSLGLRTHASFTRRTSQDTGVVVVGGDDLYQPSCRVHHEHTLPYGRGHQTPQLHHKG